MTYGPVILKLLYIMRSRIESGLLVGWLVGDKGETINHVISDRSKEARKDLVWFYSTSTIVRYLMQNPYFYIKTVLFHMIQLSISTQFSSV